MLVVTRYWRQTNFPFRFVVVFPVVRISNGIECLQERSWLEGHVVVGTVVGNDCRISEDGPKHLLSLLDIDKLSDKI